MTGLLPFSGAPGKSLIQLGGQKKYQLVGTRTGVSGNGFIPGVANAGQEARILHTLPKGALDIQLMYAGFQVTAAVESSMKLGGGFQCVSAAVVAGGTSYAVGDIVTPTVAANQFAPTLVVQTVAAGVVTSLGVVDPGGFAATPAAGLVTTSSGTGINCTVTLTVKPVICNIHVGLEQVWNTQTAFSSTNPNGVLKLNAGANYNGGAPHIGLPPGDFITTESAKVNLGAGAQIGTRVQTVGYNWAGGRALSGTDSVGALSEYSLTNVPANFNLPYGGAYPTDVTANLTIAQQPLAIMGTLSTPCPSFVIIGDSDISGLASTVGGGVIQDPNDINGCAGWGEKSISIQWPWSNISSSGDGLSITNWLAAIDGMRMRAINAMQPSHILLALGTNDFIAGITSAQFIVMVQAFCAKLKGIGVKEIWMASVPPRSTSTDSFATLVNQTPTFDNAQKQSFNTALRAGTVSPLITKVIDLGTDVESTIGSGIWPVGNTFDGIHGSVACNTAIALHQFANFTTAHL